MICRMHDALYARFQCFQGEKLFTYLYMYISILQEVLRMGQNKGLSLSHLSSHEIESKLAETLNGEVIEPMLRVWRAYQYAIRHPQCDSYVICAVNQHDPSANQGAGLRPGVTKLGRFVTNTVQCNTINCFSVEDFHPN